MSAANFDQRRIPWSLVVLAGAITALAPMSVDMYLPTLPTIRRAFAASPEAIQATLGAFLIGLAVGQFLYGPTSDRVGRRLPLLAGLTLYLAASVACAFAPSIETMIVARFVQALGGSAGQVLARASIRDRFDHQTSARVLSMLMLVMGVAPMVAPLAGGWLLVFGWRSIFIVQMVVGGAIALWALIRFDETHSPENAAIARGESVWRSYGALLTNPRLIGYILAGAFNGGALFAYIASAPNLLIEVYGISPVNFGWVFGINAAGMIAVSQVNAHLLRWRTPEDILTRARPASIVCALAMVGFAVTGFGGMWGVLISLFLTIATFGMVGPNTQAAGLNVDTSRTGAISSLMGAATFAVGATMSILSGALHDGTARPLSYVILVSILLSSAALYGLARPFRTAATGA
jgi:DHA1 family bicyclomycin/chloramphenicol resistance-like MFS transporter